jgi:hypothetical protein
VIEPTSTVPHQSVEVVLTIRNVTDHVVDLSNALNPHAVGLVCAADLTLDGLTNEALIAQQNFWFVTNPPLEPGDTGGSGPWAYTPTVAGTVRCEGVIITSPDQWKTVLSAGRLTGVPPAELTVT